MRAVIKGEFKWNPTFFSRKNKKFEEMQSALDKSCMKYMTEYVPVAPDRYANAGKLREAFSNPEPGHIIYSGTGRTFSGEPISRHAYYTPMNHLRSGNPQATHMWFETMKEKDMGKILSDVRKAGGDI